jgi:cobalamin biosynthetic protein CobC
VVLRSFGKFYGLPGLRPSFVIASQEVAARIATALGPWPIAGAALAIGNTAWPTWRGARRLAEAAARLDGLFAKSGLEVIGGTSLFRLVRTRNAAQLFQRLG